MDDDGRERAARAAGVLLSQHFLSELLTKRFAGRLGEKDWRRGHRRAARWWRDAAAVLGPSSGVRAIRDVGEPLFALLGYRLRTVTHDERTSTLHCELETRRGERLDLVIVSWSTAFDRVWRTAVRASERSNRRWVLAFNGRALGVLDVERPYARRHLEFDLSIVLPDERGFAMFWGLMRSATFAGASERRAMFDEVVAVSEAHGADVRTGLQGGVRIALMRLSVALGRSARRASDRVDETPDGTRDETPDEIVSQALTVIYRLLFLLFAEARALVPIWHPVYRQSYSLTALQRQIDMMPCADTDAATRSGTASRSRSGHTETSVRGLWDAIRAISRLAHAGCRTDEFSMTAFNGRLFSPSATPLAEHRRLSSIVVADVLRALTRTRAGPGRRCERITYSDLGVEELGTIYERVLDHVQAVEAATAAVCSRVSAARRSRQQEGTQQQQQHLKPRQEQEREHEQEGQEQRQERGEQCREPTLSKQAVSTQASSMQVSPVQVSSMQASSFAPGVDADHGARGQEPVAIVSRKASGTFYTPRSMADYLVHATLAPLVADASPERVLTLRVLDPAMGSGAFLVCACRYLAWAYERALERAGRAPPPNAAARAEIRRVIARQCLFGVDVNPVAVQLARLSLWLTSLMADAPLTFLDHHLRVGDSLIGVMPADLIRRGPAEPATPADRSGRRRPERGTGAGAASSRKRSTTSAAAFPLFATDDLAVGVRGVLRGRAVLQQADDSPVTVRRKERLLERLARDQVMSAWRKLADLWCASWFWDSGLGVGPPARAWPAMCDFVMHGQAQLPRAQMEGWLQRTDDLSRQRRFFHWAFEFPEVFHDADGEMAVDGGFDAIVGNPPWHVLRAEAVGGGEAREEQRTMAGMLGRFVRESGIYEPLPDAHPNLYQLFIDRSLNLLKPGGRLGLIVPWGLACDHGSARLRRRLFERSAVDTIISFENSGRVFPIHRGLRFLLFTCTEGGETDSVRCRLGERDARQLEREQSPGGGVRLTMGVLRRVSGEGLAIPDVRTDDEVALLDRLHARWPPLGGREGWGLSFGRELNATDDRALLERRDQSGESTPPSPAAGMPVIEGKHLRPYRVNASQATHRVRPDAEQAVRARLAAVGRRRLAYREVSFPGQRFALVAAMLPAGVVTTHTVFCLKTMVTPRMQWCLCALLNSLACNYLVRVRAGSHVTATLIQGMPVPRLLRSSVLARELARLARRLSLGQTASGDGELGGLITGRRERRWYAQAQALAAVVYELREPELRLLLRLFGFSGDALGAQILRAYRVAVKGGG